jgi:hypothetical protein
MGKVNSKKRRIKIRIRNNRKMELAKLRRRYVATKTDGNQEKVMEKVHRIAPWLSRDEFLGQAKK